MVPTTELAAVNSLLSAIGEMPVDSLVSEQVDESAIAQTILSDVTTEVQGVGLHCNTDDAMKLVPDSHGNITLPPNMLLLRASDRSLNVTQRGQKLYDKTNFTYVFTAPYLQVDVITYLDFSDLPQDVRNYITIRASRVFIRKVLGSDTLSALTKEDEGKALVEMKIAESERMQTNFFGSGNPVTNRQSIVGRY